MTQRIQAIRYGWNREIRAALIPIRKRRTSETFATVNIEMLKEMQFLMLTLKVIFLLTSIRAIDHD